HPHGARAVHGKQAKTAARSALGVFDQILQASVDDNKADGALQGGIRVGAGDRTQDSLAKLTAKITPDQAQQLQAKLQEIIGPVSPELQNILKLLLQNAFKKNGGFEATAAKLVNEVQQAPALKNALDEIATKLKEQAGVPETFPSSPQG